MAESETPPRTALGHAARAMIAAAAASLRAAQAFDEMAANPRIQEDSRTQHRETAEKWRECAATQRGYAALFLLQEKSHG